MASKFKKIFIVIIQLIQLKFNEFLDKLKFKAAKRCAAKNYHSREMMYTIPCSLYTFKEFCDEHTFLYRQSCNMYHFMADCRLSHISNSVKAEAELSARIQFAQRFAKKTDWGHAKWLDYLKKVIHSATVKSSIENEIKAMRRQCVLFDEVCMQTFNQARISLEPGVNFHLAMKTTTTTAASVNEWSSADDTYSTKQCDKIKINQFLFDRYYQRNDMLNMNYMNLICPKRQYAYCDYIDNESW